MNDWALTGLRNNIALGPSGKLLDVSVGDVHARHCLGQLISNLFPVDTLGYHLLDTRMIVLRDRQHRVGFWCLKGHQGGLDGRVPGWLQLARNDMLDIQYSTLIMVSQC